MLDIIISPEILDFWSCNYSIAPLIGASLIGAGTSILGGIFGSMSQSSANETNLQVARENREWQEKMWNQQNEYNTPSNQLKLASDAGVNPLTAYANLNGVSGAGNVSTPNLPQVNPTDYSFLQNAGNILANMQLQKEQARNLRADSEQKEIDNQTRYQKNKVEIDNLQKEGLKLSADYDNLKQQYKILLEQEKNARKEGENLDANTQKTKDENSRAAELQPKLIEYQSQQILNLQEQLRLMSYEAKTRRISANAQAQQAQVASRLCKVQEERWQMEHDKVIPEQIKILTEQANVLISQGKLAEANRKMAEYAQENYERNPQWVKQWFGEGGYVRTVCGAICEPLGLALDAVFKGKTLKMLGAQQSAQNAVNQQNANTNEMNARTNQQNANTNQQRLNMPTYGQYGNSYGINSTWNP